MKAGNIPNECIGDARFVKVLAASLCSEIAESKIILTEINTGIEELKESVSNGWKRRKILKHTIYELSKKKHVLTGALESLTKDEKHRSIEIETAKNRLDDGTLRQIEERAEFVTILQNYHDTWQEYKVEYEKRPLSIERQQCWINLKQLGVRYMIAQYKKEEFMKIMRQRCKINAVRIKRSLVDTSEMVLNHWKDEKHLEHLKRTTKKMRDELAAYTHQLSEMQQREIERKRLAESDDTAKMPPPRLDFPFMRSINYAGKQRIQQQRSFNHTEYLNNSMEHWRLTPDDSDTASINTLMLEEIFHEDLNSSLPRTKDRARISNNEANDSENVQEEYHDIVSQSSILMFQKTTESICPMKSQTSKNAAEPSTSIIISESNIRHKLQKLDIQKKNDSLPQYYNHHRQRPHHHEQQRPTANYDELNKNPNATNNNCHNDDGHDKETKEYKKDINNVEDSRHQRTRRWCEKLTYKNPSPVYMSPNYKDSGSPDQETPLMMTECHSIVGENGKRQQENSCRKTNEKNKKSKMDGNKWNSRGPGASHGEQRDPLMGSRLTDSIRDSTIEKRFESRKDYSKTHLSHDDESSRPKMRRLATNDDPPYIMEQPPQQQQQQQQQQQRGERAFTSDPNQSANSSPSLRYVSSCTNSDNSSHIGDAAFWQETPKADHLKTNVDFPSLSIWQNWSPPQLNSEISFDSSSITGHQDDKKDDTPIQRQKIAHQNNSFLDFGGFTTKTNQKPRKMF